VAKELDDYRFGEKRGLVEGLLDDDGDIDDEDELVREFHLYEHRMKLAKGKKHSPLEELESQLRTIDRVTAASGSALRMILSQSSKHCFLI